MLFKSKWTGWINTNCRKSKNLMIWTNNFKTALYLSSSFFLNALSFLYSGGRPTVQTCGKLFQKMKLFHEVITCGCLMFFFNNNLLSSPHGRIVKSVVLGRRRRCTTPEKASFNLLQWLHGLNQPQTSVDLFENLDHLYLTSFSPSCLYSNSLLKPSSLKRQIQFIIESAQSSWHGHVSIRKF